MEYIAHRNKKGLVQEQSFGDHAEAVAEMTAEFLKDIGCEHFGRLQGKLHDCGKLTDRFQNYIREVSCERRGEIDHSYAGAKYICELADELDEKRYKNVSQIIAHTIVSHHGLHDWLDEEGGDYLGKRVGKSDGFDEIRPKLEEIFNRETLVSLLENAEREYALVREKIYDFAKGRTEKSVEFAFYLGALERIFQSALIDADRIDSAVFMGNERGERRELPPWETMERNIERKLCEFEKNAHKISAEIFMQRKSISDRCAKFAENKVGVCRLIVPTGGGKTLSSMRFAVRYCQKHGMKRIVYIAPFLSILDQNSDDIHAIAGEENFIEHHSNAFSDLSDREDSEELKEYELHAERWDLPVIATTMVQMLNTLFSAKTSSVRRMHRLCKSVIIIDEAQSVPLKCVNLLNLMLNFLTQFCGAAVVLCSATQPASNITHYPLAVDKLMSMTGDFEEDFRVFHRSTIISEVNSKGFSFEETAEFCKEKFLEEGNLLLIVNTKAAALNLYKRIKENCDDQATVFHLSTNMCPQHRREKIDAIRKCLKENEPVICVTTQLIEAGVDISFRCVVRSLAGLDNAVQAAGRCNRNGECDTPKKVYVIRIKEERVEQLSEIRTAQHIFSGMLNAEKYDDWQSYEAVKEYFSQLYESESSKMSYSVSDHGTSTNLVNLLARNCERYEMSRKETGKYSSQAFKTAGMLFEVIDKQAIDVIVPYNEDAEKLMEEIKAPTKELSAHLRKAQKYMVGVYKGTQSKLSEMNAIHQLPNGIFLLDNRFYNSDTGLVMEGIEQEILIY